MLDTWADFGVWERTPWWDWHRWIGKPWRRLAEVGRFVPEYEWQYATSEAVARDFLMEQFGG
jgi:hypothetical protein